MIFGLAESIDFDVNFRTQAVEERLHFAPATTLFKMPPVASAGGMSGPSTFDKGIRLQKCSSEQTSNSLQRRWVP